MKTTDVSIYTILDYQIEKEPVTRILLEMADDRTIIADFATLLEINENAGMYLNDPFYYRGEILEMCKDFIEEVEDYNYL